MEYWIPPSPLSPEFRHTAHEIIRHTEVETLRCGHFECEISVALALQFLGARQLKLSLVAHVIANHLLEYVVDRRRQKMHAEPAEKFVRTQSIDAQPIARG